MNKQVVSLMEKIKEVNGNTTTVIINEQLFQGELCALLRINTKGGYLFDVIYNSKSGRLIDGRGSNTYMDKIEATHIIDFLLEVLSLELKFKKEPKTENYVNN